MKCQQLSVYLAEGGVDSERLEVDALQAYVDSLRETPYWEANFPGVLRVEAYLLAGGDTSVSGWFPDQHAGIIEIAPAHLNTLIVLHEVAHVCAEARYGSQSHDPWFARTYLELVSLHLGADTYVALCDAFDRAGVDYDHDSSAKKGIAL